MCTHFCHIGTNWHPGRQFQPRDQGLTGRKCCAFGEGRGTLAGGRVESSPATALSVVWRNKIASVDTSLVSLDNHNIIMGRSGGEIRKATWVRALSPETVSLEGS